MQSCNVRHEFPSHAAYFRQILPPVVGFPHLKSTMLDKTPQRQIATSRCLPWIAGRWVANPCPTGTRTPQEASSLARRDNATHRGALVVQREGRPAPMARTAAPGYTAPRRSGHLRICHIWHTLHPMNPKDKPLVWLHGVVKTPPFSAASRVETGYLLRRLQRGENLSLPQSRPMPSIGPHCHELRITDKDKIWRIVYRIDSDAIRCSRCIYEEN